MLLSHFTAAQFIVDIFAFPWRTDYPYQRLVDVGFIAVGIVIVGGLQANL